MTEQRDRIHTTHVGSLPRPDDLLDLLTQKQAGETVDPAEFESAARSATMDAVSRQVDAGIDVVNDGEQSRVAFNRYVTDRLEGFAGEGEGAFWADLQAVPGYLERAFGSVEIDLETRPAATGDVEYGGTAPVEREIERFRGALDEVDAEVEGTFLTAASPGIVATSLPNHRYETHEEYVFALADALRPEYERIADAGFQLQVDAPDLLGDFHRAYADADLDEFREVVRTHVEALNLALVDVDAADVRLHTCWGNYEGPHHLDVGLTDLLPEIYEAHVGTLCVEQASPRHQHEYRAFEEHPLPDDWSIAPGVVDTTTNVVEHPETVADRIERVAEAVGDPSRVLAAPDCGFGTVAGLRTVDREIVWKKLATLVEGADVATDRLF